MENLPTPKSCRPEIALAELDRAYRALENWGVTEPYSPSAGTGKVRPLRTVSFEEVRDLYVTALELLETQEVWPAEHIARAVQHLAQAGWHEARLHWRRRVSGNESGPRSDPSPKDWIQIPRPHSPLPHQLQELRDAQQNTECLVLSIQSMSHEFERPRSQYPRWIPRLSREALRHWQSASAAVQREGDTSVLAGRMLDELRETLGLVQELAEAVLCLRLAWNTTRTSSLRPNRARAHRTERTG